MKIILTETQIKNLSKLLLEYTAHPFKEKSGSNKNDIQYTFNVDDLIYDVHFHNPDRFNNYVLGFKVDNKPYKYETKKDLKHLNNVLHTIDNIVREAVKKYKVKKIHFIGESSDGEAKGYTIRHGAYERYIKQNYPNVKFISLDGTTIDLTTMFPEFFREEILIKNKFLDVLTKINGGNRDDDWEYKFDVTNDKNIEGTAKLYNDQYGSFTLDINYNYNAGYGLNIETDIEEDVIEKEFKNLNELIKFLEKMFNLPLFSDNINKFFVFLTKINNGIKDESWRDSFKLNSDGKLVGSTTLKNTEYGILEVYVQYYDEYILTLYSSEFNGRHKSDNIEELISIIATYFSFDKDIYEKLIEIIGHNFKKAFIRETSTHRYLHLIENDNDISIEIYLLNNTYKLTIRSENTRYWYEFKKDKSKEMIDFLIRGDKNNFERYI